MYLYLYGGGGSYLRSPRRQILLGEVYPCTLRRGRTVHGPTGHALSDSRNRQDQESCVSGGTDARSGQGFGCRQIFVGRMRHE